MIQQRQNPMTSEEFDRRFETYDLDAEYADYILAHAQGDRVIPNGDALIDAMDEEYLLEEFRNFMTDGE